MNKYVSIFFISLLSITGCKQKKNTGNSGDSKEIFFPVLSFIRSQIAHIDTSLYPIKKIIFVDSIHSDTAFIPREDFHKLAKDFLEIPDLTDKKFKDKYQEEKMFDEQLNRVNIIYTPKYPDKEEIQKQQVLIKPDPSGDKVMSIFIDKVVSNKDSFLQKSMLWQVDKSFQVTTTAQKPGQNEKVTIMKVTWDEED